MDPMVRPWDDGAEGEVLPKRDRPTGLTRVYPAPVSSRSHLPRKAERITGQGLARS
ncbi:hypothetical protein JM93_00894 [Roseibium hamelinense]|uniref:Uncharacterized protein n=1 Tax=Roseibium hamelinense TaxID=150831 RepID=A0A562TJ86_9HYPH|nr:hypothetical protein JM93_00894 [Roseibium hamelinense]